MITIELLERMGEVINMTGEPMRGAGWYGHTTGLHTIAIRVLNFQGRIRVQASVATEPDVTESSTDWYSVLPADKEFRAGCGYIQYPHLDYIVQSPNNGETSIIGFNFNTNAVWVRALVIRDYLIPPTSTPLQMMPYGCVDYAKLTYSG